MITNSDIERIEKYLEGALKGDELNSFEQRLKSDQRFSDQVELYRLAIESVELYQAKIMKKRLKVIHKELYQPSFVNLLKTWYVWSGLLLLTGALIIGGILLSDSGTNDISPDKEITKTEMKPEILQDQHYSASEGKDVNDSELENAPKTTSYMAEKSVGDARSVIVIAETVPVKTKSAVDTELKSADRNDYYRESKISMEGKNDNLSSSDEDAVVRFGTANRVGCVPFEVIFWDSSFTSEGSILSYMWDFGDGNSSSALTPVHTYSKNGIFSVKLTIQTDKGNRYELVKNDLIIANILPQASFIFKPEYAIVSQPSFEFANTTLYETPGTSYSWDFGDNSGNSNRKNPVYSYKDTGSFVVTLIAQNEYKCHSSFSKKVKVVGEVLVFIPDAFSPDGKGPLVNDVFQVSAVGVKRFELFIHNRYGDMVYQSSDYANHAWDGRGTNGKMLPAGIYICTLRIIGIDDKIYDFTKPITMLR